MVHSIAPEKKQEAQIIIQAGGEKSCRETNTRRRKGLRKK